MNEALLGVIVGGIIPAFLYGISGAFQKGSSRIGIGVGPYLICAGLAVIATGLGWLVLMPDRTVSIRSGLYAGLGGLLWAGATGCVVFALLQYSAPLAKLVPLYNMNTLVTVLIALIVFSEFSAVSVPKLLVGALLIIVGGTLVAQA